MTRWSTNDICGRVLREDHDEWYQFKREAYNGGMLCEDFLNYERYLDLKKYMIPEIFDANYHQEPVEIKGTLYKAFKTYKEVPRNAAGSVLFQGIYNYTDTADEGDSYLCSVCYGIFENYVYIIDVYFTKDGMEITEPETASFLIRNKVNVAKIESNNGGRGFARNVRTIIKQKNERVHITWFHQSKNKMARILSESAFVQNNILFPDRWSEMWPEFFKHLRTFKKDGKNKITDGADAITGVAENHKGVFQPPNVRVSKPR
jgi:predicted phage terminase large subunit-like protein